MLLPRNNEFHNLSEYVNGEGKLRDHFHLTVSIRTLAASRKQSWV